MSESAVDEFDDDQQLQNRRLYIYIQGLSSQCRKLIRLHADDVSYAFIPYPPFRDLHSRICISIWHFFDAASREVIFNMYSVSLGFYNTEG